MKRRLFRLLPLVILSVSAVQAQYQILFMGMKGGGAPACEESFEHLLRHELTTIEALKTIDYVETQRYREMTDFLRYATVSQKSLNSLQKFISDSVLIIWGSVNSLELKPVRKNVFGAAIKGELTARILVYDLLLRGYAYNGNITGTVSARGSPVFLSPVGKVTHITAAQRASLTDSLIRSTVLSSVDVIKSILETARKPDSRKETETNQQNAAPSISDVFTVPSVEAARIERGTPAAKPKKDTKTTDTAKNVPPK